MIHQQGGLEEIIELFDLMSVTKEEEKEVEEKTLDFEKGIL